LNVIQFVVGSYIEPRVHGSALAISPFVVLFAVFLWTLLWGLFGAFIGVPITIVILTFCAQHPSSRWLADLLGRKMLYTWGFVIFITGSALCGFAPTLNWLIATRVLQAIGAAMLQANSVAIITAAVPRRALGRAIGVQGAAQAVGLSVGPSVGGVLIDSLGWQWVFLLEGFPSVLLGILVLAYLTDRPEDAQWLTAREQKWLVVRLSAEREASRAAHPIGAMAAPWAGRTTFSLRRAAPP